MTEKELGWQTLAERELAAYRIFTVGETTSRAADGKTARFVTLDAPDWCIVVATVVEDGRAYFLMVRQYRHGSGCLSLEFPGGVIEPGEKPEEAACRELREETGFAAPGVRLAATMNPNPAFMRNTQYIFLADALRHDGEQELDENERIRVEKVPVDEVIRWFGKPPYVHALMASALFYWQRERGNHEAS